MLLALLPLVFSLRAQHRTTPKTSQVDLSQLIERVEQKLGSIKRAVFNPTDLQVTATLAGGGELKAHLPSDQSALKLEDLLQAQKVDFGLAGPQYGSAWSATLVTLLPP